MLQMQVVSSGNLSMDHYFLCSYLPMKAGNDELSQSLLRFKSRRKIDLQAWVECSVQELDTILSDQFIVVRALHHTENVSTFSGLDTMGVELSNKFKCAYHPGWLVKVRNTKELKPLRRADRVAELKDAYQFIPEGDAKKASYLIIDDILTTGTTAFSIARAIREKDEEASVSVFSLARVDYDTQLNQSLSFYNDSYHWESRTGWAAHEEELVYNQLHELKRKILADRF